MIMMLITVIVVTMIYVEVFNMSVSNNTLVTRKVERNGITLALPTCNMCAMIAVDIIFSANQSNPLLRAWSYRVFSCTPYSVGYRTGV